MEVAFEYTKKRSEFGKHCQFTDGETTVLESILPTDAFDESYINRTTMVTAVDTTPFMTESSINTERVVYASTSMQHREGAWPKDVDPTEQSDVKRFRKRVEKDAQFDYATKMLVPKVEKCLMQNNTVNIYESYFAEEEANHYSEPPFAMGLAVFRDPSPVTRSATSVNWHPEGGRLAVSYSVPNFQDERLGDVNMPNSSYIWDITNSNKPIVELTSHSLLTCLKYNPKSSDTLVAGSYNGTVSYYDLRKPNGPAGKCCPIGSSVIEKSHHDPVSDIFWVSSKTGHQCVSVSTDGQMFWWDTRKLEEPIDTLVLDTDSKGGGVRLGGSSLEYSTEAGPSKFLVGTEQGSVMSINLRNKKTNNGITVFDAASGKHHGKIPSIQRNPTHNKFFLTVGDWSAKIWSDDLKSPIITSQYHNSYLTSGCWSPTRAGVFYVTRSDGVLDVWDISHDQNEVAYSHKVSDVALTSISIEGGGKLVAVGDANGIVSLLEVCDSLAQPQQNEKASVNAIFERETKREKNLEAREREVRRTRAAKEKNGNEEVKVDGTDAEAGLLSDLEKAFFEAVKGDD